MVGEGGVGLGCWGGGGRVVVGGVGEEVEVFCVGEVGVGGGHFGVLCGGSEMFFGCRFGCSLD